MALTNAEKQKRWRERRNALAKQAILEQGACIFCYEQEPDLKDDDIITIKKAGHIICEKCVEAMGAAIARAKAKARRAE
jgi:hypothetical protein